MTTIVGVDPGISGALALYDVCARKMINVCDLPVVGSPAMVDADGLAWLLTQWAPDEAIIEDVHAMKGQGVSSMFRFGKGAGIIVGVLAGLRIPRRFVSPQRWKSHYGLGKEKENSRRLAIERFPTFAEQLRRKHDHQRAEAMLIAHYGAVKTLPTTEHVHDQLEQGAGRSPDQPA